MDKIFAEREASPKGQEAKQHDAVLTAKVENLKVPLQSKICGIIFFMIFSDAGFNAANTGRR